MNDDEYYLCYDHTSLLKFNRSNIYIINKKQLNIISSKSWIPIKITISNFKPGNNNEESQSQR